MFSWLFPPSCPCDRAGKAWIERRLQWLTENFDDHAFNGRPLVLPTREFFPDPYDCSESSIRALLDRVCGYMDADPETIRLELFHDRRNIWLVNDAGQYLPTAAGTFQEVAGEFVVRIDESGLDDPMGLVGTMAHEVAHARLLGERRIRDSVFDNELLTDLTVVFFGLGLFLANTPRTWDSQYSKWPGTDLNKPEYMTRPMFGYALAHLAWFRGERKPAWTKHLHLNARPDLQHAIRFLFETQDSSFRPLKFRDGRYR